MTIDKTQTGGTLTLALGGRLDTTTAPLLEAEIKAIPTDATALILNLADLSYVSSAGLRVILAAQKLMAKQGSLTLTHVQDGVMEVFDVTGFSSILKFA